MLVSLYLAAYQLGLISYIFDPLFGSGSVKVLRSSFSSKLPVPDAAIGAVGYAVELWCAVRPSRPKVVQAVYCWTAFCMAAGGLGLFTLQLLVIRSFCFFCLVSTAVSIAIAGLVVSEL